MMLNDLTVLVTRPAAKAGALMEALQQHGATVHQVPTLKIVPVTAASLQDHSLPTYLQDLDQYQFLIFVSSHSAALGMALIEDRWAQLPAGIQWIAVGPATAAELERSGSFLSAGLSALVPQHSMDSPGLLKLSELQQGQVEGKRVLLVRGVGGLNVLVNGLQERGAQVDVLEVYARECPPFDDVRTSLHKFVEDFTGQSAGSHSLGSQPLKSKAMAICAYSGESVENLAKLLRHYQQEFEPSIIAVGTIDLLFAQCHLLAISARVAQIAKESGFRQVSVVDSAGPLNSNQKMMPKDSEQRLVSADANFFAALSLLAGAVWSTSTSSTP